MSEQMDYQRIKVLISTDIHRERLEITRVFALLCCNNMNLNINGSINLLDKYPPNTGIYIYANLCNSEGEIMYVVRDYKKYTLPELNKFFSFSISFYDISREIDVNKLDYIEIYILFEEANRED